KSFFSSIFLRLFYCFSFSFLPLSPAIQTFLLNLFFTYSNVFNSSFKPLSVFTNSYFKPYSILSKLLPNFCYVILANYTPQSRPPLPRNTKRISCPAPYF
ncbi:MAG: hypothetical protein RR348_03435, partial [Clostridia bacterium]